MKKLVLLAFVSSTMLISKAQSPNSTPPSSRNTPISNKIKGIKISTTKTIQKSEQCKDPITETNNTELSNWSACYSWLKLSKNLDKLKAYINSLGELESILKPDLNSSDSSFKNISYSLLALQEEQDIKAYYEANNIKPIIQGAINLYISQIKEFYLSNTSPPSFAILASGDATSFINSNNNPGSSTSGSLGFKYATDKINFSFLLKLASTTQPLTKGWATSLVSPIASQAAFGSFIADAYFKLNKNPFLKIPSDKWFLNAYTSFSSCDWQTDSIKMNTNKASIVSTGLLLCYNFFNGFVGKTPVGSSAKFGLTARYLGGDITNLSGTDSLNFKNYILPTTTKLWFAPEIDVLFNIGKVVGKFQATVFTDKSLGNNTASKGFTGLQLSFGINASIEVIEGLLTPKSQ